MKVCRRNEDARVWFRSERVFLIDDSDWYFQTREGVDVGPYESQCEAEIEAGLLKELLLGCANDEAVMAMIREFVLDSFAMGRPLNPRFRESLRETASIAL